MLIYFIYRLIGGLFYNLSASVTELFSFITARGICAVNDC